MNYKEFINHELRNNLSTVFNKMLELDIMDEKEFRKSLKILDNLRNSRKTISKKKTGK